MIEKYVGLFSKRKNLWNMKVTSTVTYTLGTLGKFQEYGLKELKSGERISTIQSII